MEIGEINYVGKTALNRFLEKIRGVFAPLSHKHSIEDITDLPVADASLSATSTNAVQNKVINAEIDRIDSDLAQKTQVQIITWGADD